MWLKLFLIKGFMTLNNQQKLPVPWSLIIAFAVFTIIIILAGALYIKKQNESFLDTQKEELKAISDLKTGQIVRWWHERIGDAILIQENSALVEQIGIFMESQDAVIKKGLQSWMNSVINTFDYSRAAILDNNGNEKLSVPDSNFRTNPSTRPLIPAVFESRKVKLTDMYFDEADSTLGLDLIIPLTTGSDTEEKNIGVMILRIDPQKILFPLIQSWQTSSKTSESLILKADGDSALYLNDLKYIPSSAMRLKIPASDTTLLSTLALRGFEGVSEGLDYRRVKVLGVIKKIPGTSWYMIAKNDMLEIRKENNRHLLLIKLIVIFVIGAFGALTGSGIWRQRMVFYRGRYEAEAQKMALRKHFDHVLKYANDIIILLDKELNIVEINDHALEVYSYSRDEIIGMNLSKLRLAENIKLLEDQVKILQETGQTRFETIHRRKDGTTFPLEISARYFEIDGVEYYQSIGRDITERKKIEENLNELLERFNLAIEVARLAVWEWDVSEDVLVWDDKVYELYGIERGSLPAKYESWLKLLHPEDSESADLIIRNAISGSGNFSNEFRIILPDKTIRYIKAYGQIVKDAGGNPVKMIGINYDITDQKTSENLLREREYWLSESQKAGKIGSYVFDIKTLIWTSSEVLDEIFGIDREYEKTLDSWNNIVHSDYKDEMIDYVENHVIANKMPFDREYKVINQKTGMERWVYGRGEVRLDKEGNPTVLIGTIQDITDRKESELLLRDINESFEGIFNSVGEAIYIHKPDGPFIDVNPGAVKMYGYSRDELLQMTPSDVGAPGRNDMKKIQGIIDRVFTTGESKTFEFWGMKKSGEIFPKEVVANKGKYFGQDIVIATARDITDRKKVEAELLIAKEKAEESDRLKTAFLHNISHEIRTPMNAIVGFTALLDEPDLDSEGRKQFVHIITQSTNQLLAIISDIVDISNIETNQVKLVFSKVEILPVIKSLFEKYSPEAEQRKILFAYNIENNKGNTEITTDKAKLVQIISNLLANAFKYTMEGSIEFGYRSADTGVEFFVKDTGIGIPADKHEKVFERFYQIDSMSSRSFGGSGLGLSISRAYVELLGGKITLKSEPGKGTEVTFSHPY